MNKMSSFSEKLSTVLSHKMLNVLKTLLWHSLPDVI